MICMVLVSFEILSNSTLNTLKKEKNYSACIFFVNRSLQMTIAGRYELENTLGSQNEALPSHISHLINSVRPGSIDPMTAVVQRVKAFCVLLSFLFHDTTRLNGTLFLIYFISLFHLTP